MERPVSRRTVLATLGGATSVAVAGCLGGADQSHDCELTEPDPVAELERPTLGPDDAGVVVSAFDDFGCPHCATFKLDEFPEFRTEYVEEGLVQFRQYDFPIPADGDWSEPIANAARGVQDRFDDETYFEYATLLFEQLRGDGYSYEAIGEHAETVGDDGCLAIADAEFEPYETVVGADREEGVNRGVSGTPTVFVDDQQVDPTFEAISDAIDDRL